MKKLLCWLFGHRFRYFENCDPDLAEYCCHRCGKHLIMWTNK